MEVAVAVIKVALDEVAECGHSLWMVDMTESWSWLWRPGWVAAAAVVLIGYVEHKSAHVLAELFLLPGKQLDSWSSQMKRKGGEIECVTVWTGMNRAYREENVA